MSSFMSQDVINLVVFFSIRRCPNVFLNVAMWEHSTLDNQDFLTW